MLTRLLRLFPQFRALEADRDATVLQIREALQDSENEKMLLQDRLDGVMADRAELWKMMREAIENERDTLRTMANYRIQSTFGVTPYPEAGALPESREPQQIDPTPRWQTPSERVAQAGRKFREKFVEQNSH